MPRIPILKDQSNVIADTQSGKGSYILVMRAADATPVFWSQSRGDLDGNIDAGGNPQSGMPMFQTDPAVILVGVKAVIWGRAATNTFVYVELMEMNFAVFQDQKESRAPLPQPKYIRPQGPIPMYQEGWKGKY